MAERQTNKGTHFPSSAQLATRFCREEGNETGIRSVSTIIPLLPAAV
jgi:hypothetical protein